MCCNYADAVRRWFSSVSDVSVIASCNIAAVFRSMAAAIFRVSGNCETSKQMMKNDDLFVYIKLPDGGRRGNRCDVQRLRGKGIKSFGLIEFLEAP